MIRKAKITSSFFICLAAESARFLCRRTCLKLQYLFATFSTLVDIKVTPTRMFTCQKDSFLKQIDTEILEWTVIPFVDVDKVISSVGIDPKLVEGRKLFKVLLKDTVFFPEGGGQPDDRGEIALISSSAAVPAGSVVRVIRNGTVAEHYVTFQDDVGELWKAGAKVVSKIDWNRRFDHMQQHSGQHLITAIADTMFGFPTTSWWLGNEESYIELGTKEISESQIRSVEQAVNEKIREGISVEVDVVSLDDPKLKTARGRNLPEDVTGNIRIVTMRGVESNVCCGTHVTNLSQLQVIQLLHVIKKKGRCLLHFVYGNRAVAKFSAMFSREQKLMEILNSCPTDLPAAGERLSVALKAARKSVQTLSKDLAAQVAKEFKANNGNSKFWVYHRDNVDLSFATNVMNELGDHKKSTVILISLKIDGTSGSFTLSGPETLINSQQLTKVGDELCTILDGKGSLQRGNVFQAKVNKINAISKAQAKAKQSISEFISES